MGIEKRGFASMAKAKLLQAASKGGKAAHSKGTAYEWNIAEARRAGRKGGTAKARNRRKS